MTVLRSGSATDVGRVRKVNQDLPLEAPNLYAVADGMGGHVGGEVAAQVAVDALLRVFTREPTRAGLPTPSPRRTSAVWQESQEHSELRGMGTTLTAVALVGGDDGRDTLALANVGDSRAYLFSDDQIVQVTADHSLAEERMRHGEMTEEEAAVHPQRHILTRALGVASEVEADMWELQLRSGDRVVLCSDGLSNELTNDEMAEVLSTEPDPGEAAHQLVEIANEHGGSDNITVVVVDVLVGEDTPAHASVITPLGARAGSPLLVGPGSESDGAAGPNGGAAPDRPASDAFAQGTQLGFGGQSTSLRGEGLRTGEFFPDTTQAVPVARATDRSAVSPPPSVATRPARRDPASAPAPARDPAAHHAARRPVHPADRRRPDGGVLRHPLVRLRQLVRGRAEQQDRHQAGSSRRGPVVPSQGRRPRPGSPHHSCSPPTWPRSTPGCRSPRCGGEALRGQPSERVHQRAERQAAHRPPRPRRPPCPGAPPVPTPTASTTPPAVTTVSTPDGHPMIGPH